RNYSRRSTTGSTQANLERLADHYLSFARTDESGSSRVVNRGALADAVPKLRHQQPTEIIQMVSKSKKTAADAARLFGVHPSTVCQLLAASIQSESSRLDSGGCRRKFIH